MAVTSIVRFAARSGNLLLLQYLEEQAGRKSHPMIQASGSAAFELAAKGAIMLLPNIFSKQGKHPTPAQRLRHFALYTTQHRASTTSWIKRQNLVMLQESSLREESMEGTVLFKRISYIGIAALQCLCIMSNSIAYADSAIPNIVSPASPGRIYIGLFAGGETVHSDALKQEGTAYLASGLGGPLAVNAFGTSSSASGWFGGGHIGYQGSRDILNNPGSAWTFLPAAELEGYYLGNITLRGVDLNNSTARLEEHDFHVTYPMSTNVFLMNAILDISHAYSNRVHLYAGFGIGSGIISISGAYAAQVAPEEPGINHYNSDTSDTAVAFAAQPKLGLRFDLTQHASLFAEYRFLYLSPTNYLFGSTVYSTHVATSNWDVKMGSQNYNMGAIGIDYAV